MAEKKWTASQLAAIHTLGRSVLVSAGAGSGKTAVLAERCASLVAEEAPPCPVDRLLVVTFTDAASAEMRQRIAEALRRRLAAKPTNAWLQRQLALLDAASISTLHSFCRRVLARYFAQAELDPLAPVMDADDAALRRRKTAEGVFDDFAQREDAAGEAFLDFLGLYGGSSERSLVDRVLEVDGFLNSLPDPQAWIDQTLVRFKIESPQSLSAAWRDELTAWLRSELRQQLAVVDSQLAAMPDRVPKIQESRDCLDDYRRTLQGWLDRIDQSADAAALDEVCVTGIGQYKIPSPPRKPRDLAKWPVADQRAFAAAADTVRSISKGLFDKRLRQAVGRFSTADWAEGIARTGPHVSILLTLIRETRTAYQSTKRDLGVVDFADLERMTLDLLRKDQASVAARLRDHYQHVLVDEFQDINRVQAEILRLVSRESLDARPGNLFAVGDVKQSIYRFRLAEPRLFLARKDSFAVHSGGPPIDDRGVVIDMVENFRSRRRVIDAVNALFERLMRPDFGGIAYDEHARLIAGRPDAEAGPAGPAAELHILDRVSGQSVGVEDDEGENATGGSEAFDWQQIEREAYVVAERIKALAAEGAAYRDIVVLLRAFKAHAGLFVRTIARLGVPVFAEVSGNFFDTLEVQDVLSLLSLLDNEQQDIPLAAVLRSPLFGRPLTDSDLAEIRITSASHRACEKAPIRAATVRERFPRPAEEPLPHGRGSVQTGAAPFDFTSHTACQGEGPGTGPQGGRLPFHSAVRRYARQGRDPALQSRLAAILGRLRDWRIRVRRRPLADLLWEIYEESGYLAYVAGMREGEQRRANLLRLHEYARQFDSFKRQGLYRFLRFVEALRESGDDLEAGSVCPPNADVVRVMTIHRSKGLEFPVVFVAELGKRFNLRDARGAIVFDRQLGLALQAVDRDRRIIYPTLPHRLVSQAVVNESLAEEMRVLYVALTRARERLILVGTAPLEKLHRLRDRCAGHAGPLSVLDLQRAGSALDWLMGAVCCQPPGAVSFGNAEPSAGAAEEALFAVRTYDGGCMGQWSIDPPPREDIAERLKRCARAEPREGEAPAEPAAQAVVATVARRLTTAYPAAALARVPAVLAASVLKRRWDARQDDEEPAVQWAPVGGKSVPMPRHRFKPPAFAAAAETPDPTVRGTLTHEFLQRLDVTRPCDEADLREQLRGMIAAGVTSEAEAAVVDSAGAAWFFQTDLGKRVRGAKRLLREWPFIMGIDPTRYDPAAAPQSPEDVMLVRGIIDCLFDAGEGWEILDYKTDAVSGDSLAARAEEYRGQLAIYAAAVEATWSGALARRWLAFLTPRQIVQA